ncbi:hypothetical protein K2173_008828 [Erythroxylum novogranatense]|uniref:J domain-containing protein n=1 Tax=Erythroxylum novogranatense TaxID=1862640 RepID=A0AAV8U907_9ROSI|nr:hypothetical protein K2173_008828 [Erythroxylum novogranatense]
MQGDEARVLLGLPPDSHPSTSQVKAAYKKKVWECHPDLFPTHEKARAESHFKMVSEAYSFLLPGAVGEGSTSGVYSRVVRTGVPRGNRGRSNPTFIGIPFLFIILGTVGLGASRATRAYKKQKESNPSHNPFLP